MKVIHLIGRVLLGGFMIYSSFTNLVNFRATAGYAQALGVPFPQLSSLVAMLLLLTGGLSMLTGFQPRAGIVALVLFFVPVTLMMHQFWMVKDPIEAMIQERFFLANVGLLGSALTFLAIPLPWPYSLGQQKSEVPSSIGIAENVGD